VRHPVCVNKFAKAVWRLKV